MSQTHPHESDLTTLPQSGEAILLTGSSGVVGSTLAPLLQAQGYRVLRAVRRAPQSPDEVRWQPLVPAGEIPEEWLRKLAEKHLTEEEKAQNTGSEGSSGSGGTGGKYGCVGGGGCRVELNSRDPECPIDWPGLDVNELHAAVGNDDETSEQDSAGNQKVISSFAVGIRAHPSADEPPPPQQTDQCSDSDHHGHPGDYPQQREDICLHSNDRRTRL